MPSSKTSEILVGSFHNFVHNREFYFMTFIIEVPTIIFVQFPDGLPHLGVKMIFHAVVCPND